MPNLTLVSAILDRPLAWGTTRCVHGERGRILTLCIVDGKLAVNILAERPRPVIVKPPAG